MASKISSFNLDLFGLRILLVMPNVLSTLVDVGLMLFKVLSQNIIESVMFVLLSTNAEILSSRIETLTDFCTGIKFLEASIG